MSDTFNGTVRIEDGVNPTPEIYGTARRVTVEIIFGGEGDIVEEKLRAASALAAAQVDVLLGRSATATARPKKPAAPPPEPAPSAPEQSSAAPTPPAAPEATPAPSSDEGWETPTTTTGTVSEIKDTDLTNACAKANTGPDKVASIKETIAQFCPAGTPVPKAGLIPQADRPAFLAALADLK